MNYTDLVAAVKQYLENNETSFVTNIPLFVRLAEERIFRLMKIPLQTTTGNPVITAGNRVVPAPTGFLSVDYFAVQGTDNIYQILLPKTQDFLRAAFPDATVTGKPRYYTVRDDQALLLAPTPDQAYATEMSYMFTPPSIVDAGTSWIGANAANALLYGTLMEGYTYLKGEQALIQLYQQRFQEAIGRTKVLGENREQTDEYRNLPPAPPIT